MTVRRILKYSYIVAAYLAEDNKGLFEVRQAMLERHTEELSRVSENATSQSDKSQVLNLMGAVDKCRKNLLEFMDRGF
jgi:hypothetical protein